MSSFADRLTEAMTIKTAFTIPLFGGIPIKESVVMTWFIMAGMLIFALIMTSGMRTRNPGKRQVVIEAFVTWIEKITGDMLGEKGRRYMPYTATVLLYIAISNLLGIFNLNPPTKDINVTIALAVMSIVLIEAAGIHAKGVGKWFKSFTEPIALITPINIMEVFTKPLSLCMRLFGNVFAAFVIMELVKMTVPVVLPAALSLYFDLFDGLLQAYVFVFLTSLYIKEAIE